MAQSENPQLLSRSSSGVLNTLPAALHTFWITDSKSELQLLLVGTFITIDLQIDSHPLTVFFQGCEENPQFPGPRDGWTLLLLSILRARCELLLHATNSNYTDC